MNFPFSKTANLPPYQVEWLIKLVEASTFVKTAKREIHGQIMCIVVVSRFNIEAQISLGSFENCACLLCNFYVVATAVLNHNFVHHADVRYNSFSPKSHVFVCNCSKLLSTLMRGANSQGGLVYMTAGADKP